MAERHRQGAIDGITFHNVSIIQVALFKVALYKVTSDPFIKVASDLGLNVGSSLSELVIAA